METPALTRQAVERLQQVARGTSTERRLAIAQLRVGDVGVIRARVEAVHAERSFTRRDGSTGTLRRVTLRDGGAEVDLVLWGDEFDPDGPFHAGRQLILRGATVKKGYRGGVELHLGGAVVEPASADEQRLTATGILTTLQPTAVQGGGATTTFSAEGLLRQSDGAEMTVIFWDDAVREAVLAGVGAQIEVLGRMHGLLDDTLDVEAVRVIGGGLKRADTRTVK